MFLVIILIIDNVITAPLSVNHAQMPLKQKHFIVFVNYNKEAKTLCENSCMHGTCTILNFKEIF